ncbi:MAG: glutamate racemase [Oscillospiraceae bacterium]|nr:glutamate racemase [Oscillospiraceae bacterium]
MNDFAIGVFDSGIGGLTCVKELNRLMPNENIIYFGDTARIPYGTRSKETIKKYAAQDVEFMKKHEVKLIIAACGTVSSVLGADSRQFGETPFIGVLLPAAQAACAVTRNGKIGVIGTSATISSGAYGKAIRGIRRSITVAGNSCPLFVPLVENGFTDRENLVVKLVAEQYLGVVKKEGVDVLILGCTHYPVISEVIADYMGAGVTLISPGEEAAKHAFSFMAKSAMLSDRKDKGHNTYYVSDSTKQFAQNARLYLGEEIDEKALFKVDIEDLAL